jgi:hypothetical protein
MGQEVQGRQRLIEAGMRVKRSIDWVRWFSLS